MKNNVKKILKCTNKSCRKTFNISEMIFGCNKCGSSLEYDFEGEFKFNNSLRDDLWKNFDLIPLENEENIISLGAGGSKIELFEELSPYLNGAKLHIMLDCDKNPTGTFKDREASIIFSKCKEMGLDNLVFYSTGNTGRAYTHFAANLGLTTFCFLPKQCHYKNTSFISKNANNHIIFVDDHYQEIAPFAKKFAQDNGLNIIAPIHDRNESYATVAYEQFVGLPKCNYFVQTIASGMGVIGYYKGHKNLVKLGLEKKEDIPTIIAIQSSQMNVMSTAYNNGKTELTKEDMPKRFEDNLYEPTLNSTNPIKNYPQLLETLKDNNGIIIDVEPNITDKEGATIEEAFKKRGIILRTDIEKSLLISFSGLVKLANQGKFNENDNILLLGVGRGTDNSTDLIPPDLVINPKEQDTKELFNQLN